MNEPSLQQKYDALLEELADERANSMNLLGLLEAAERELVQVKVDLKNAKIDARSANQYLKNIHMNDPDW